MLQDLPVELILIVLRGASIRDILSLSRTASYFRRLSLANRALWLNACDARRLSLPPGETLKTANITLLPRRAARSVSIAQKFRNASTATPIRALRTHEMTGLYDLPPWAFWAPRRYAQRSFTGHAPPTFLSILPGGRAFLLGAVGNLGVYDIRGEYGHELAVPFCSRFDPRSDAGADTVAWDSGDNGAHITIAVLSNVFNKRHDVESHLAVFALEYARGSEVFSIRRTHAVTLPIHASAVCVKRSLVLARSSNALLVVDLETNQRGCWVLPDMDTEITSARLDVQVGALVLGVGSPGSRDWTRSRDVQEHAFDIPRVEGEMAPVSVIEGWPCRAWAPRAKRLAAPKQDSAGPSSTRAHSQLVLPADVAGLPTRVVAVDEVYGLVLVFVKGRLWVSQY